MEEPEQRLSALEQEARSLGAPSTSDGEALSDRGDECSEASGESEVVQGKVKQEQPAAWGGRVWCGGHPPGAPSVAEFTTRGRVLRVGQLG